MRPEADHRRCHTALGPFHLFAALCIALVFVAVPATAQQSPHGKLRFQCEECHTSTDWKQMTYPSKFKHARTGFALKGQHESVKCTACHLTLQFAVAGRRCADCHKDVHRAELGAMCDRCHSADSWVVPDMIQRHSRTRFSLVGAHAAASCESCHRSKAKHEFVGVRTDCFGCHGSDFEATKSPNHRAAGFTTDCASCHLVNASRWGGSFDHARTGFPLTGAHAATTCADCHVGNRFRGTVAHCSGCHMADFTATTNPAHSTGSGFPTDCQTCHTMVAGWRPATFDHGRTAFPLTGAHMATPCASCHVNNVYQGTSTLCVTCHQTDLATATNPPHTGFPTVCSTCHATTAWRPASFDHGRTNFPLTGAHMAVGCNECHKNNVYAGTTTLCFGCHQTDFTNTTNPRHTGFPTECNSCHTTAAWQPASFDHSKTNFPLTGAHMTTACAQCHINNIYAGTPNTCGSSTCHLAKYNATTNPKHTSAQFGTDCMTCHTTTAWVPSTFNHTTFFPIASGRHGPGTWTLCTECHTTTTDYKQFSCIQCHEHANKTNVDNDHRGENGYTYAPTSCYQCHPRGSS
jgi:Zn finger protein HypA/HybF involved in hydrogenase expression